MDWHTRYKQQANWTRDLRNYLFEHTEIKTAKRALEVGCGTGAILGEINIQSLHGLDLQLAALLRPARDDRGQARRGRRVRILVEGHVDAHWVIDWIHCHTTCLRTNA